MRCYSLKYQARYPTYKGYSVCSEWLGFSAFKDWMADQHFEGMHLDKDLIDPLTKEYSPATCAFIPSWLNKAFNENSAQRSQWGIGVRKQTKSWGVRYMASISIDGWSTFIGSYERPEEAAAAYQAARKKYLQQLIERYAGMNAADQRVVAALMARYF